MGKEQNMNRSDGLGQLQIFYVELLKINRTKEQHNAKKDKNFDSIVKGSDGTQKVASGLTIR
jgi:hypothetical protein